MSNFGVDKPSFPFLQISSESWTISRMNLKNWSRFFLFFLFSRRSSFRIGSMEICNDSRGGNEIIRYRVTGNNVDSL